MLQQIGATGILVAPWVAPLKRNFLKDMTTGKRIRELRGDIPRHEFAALIGVARNTVQDYELDKRDPSASFIKAMCERYNISADWLIFGENTKHQQHAQREEATQVNIQALVDAIDTIEQILNDKKKTIAPAHKAEIIAKIYEYYLDEEQGKSKEKIYNLLKLVA